MPNRFKSLLEILAQADVQFILIGGAELKAIKQEQEKP
jgi:hypothetical protein